MISACQFSNMNTFAAKVKTARVKNTVQQSPAGLSRPVINVDAEASSGAGDGHHISREIHMSDASASEMAITKECGTYRKTGPHLRVGAFSWGAA